MTSEVDVEVDGAGQGVGAERADDLGQPLLDGHPPCVLADQVADRGVVVVGDDDGGLVAAEARVTAARGGPDRPAYLVPVVALSTTRSLPAAPA